MTDAQTVLKLTSLIEAGLSLSQAQRALGGELELLSPAVRGQLGKLLLLAQQNGGSIAGLLEALADRIDNETRMLELIELAAASPKATARLVSLLPLICLAFAQVLGINVFAVIAKNPAALGSIAIGAGLLIANRTWLRRLLASAEAKAKAQVAEIGQLGAISLQLAAGVSVSSVGQKPTSPQLEAIFELARSQGLALLPLLRSQIKHLELRTRYEVERSLASLAVKLLMPIGLLVLPALVFLAVIPTGLALVAAK